MNRLDLMTDLAIAPIAGVVGTKLMETVSTVLYNLEPESDRKQETSVRPGPPYKIAAQKTLVALGIELQDEDLQRVGMAFHYGLAISWTPVYALLRRSARMKPITAGLTAGAAMSLIVDEGLTPALGFSKADSAYPRSTHVRAFAAHLVFGLAVAAVTEVAWKITGRAPA